jgi:hypothetical protein
MFQYSITSNGALRTAGLSEIEGVDVAAPALLRFAAEWLPA